MKFIMVVAAKMPEMGIGFQGKLPWRLSQEILTFKKITTTGNNAVIMGRKTWESIPKKFRPLPDRLNIVVSRSPPKEPIEGVKYCNDLDNLPSLIPENIDRVFMIGGSELFNYYFKSPLCKDIILTELHNDEPVELDTFLDWDLTTWELKSHEELEEFVGFEIPREFNEKGYKYKYSLYRR